ncbi:MAG: matrixin family metalloprotease, partial [Myxococcales bacterium]|nr:matrixin family metalloprotease [Myxococcales bacterium]
MRTPSILIAATALASGLLASPTAQAYDLKRTSDGYPVHWTAFPVRFVMDARGPRDLGLAAAERAVLGAFRAWQGAPGSAVAFVYDGRVQRPGIGYDRDAEVNQNVITFSGDSWTYGGEPLAVTLTLFRRGSGELVDADIVVNEHSYVWGEGAEVDNDLQNALTHEVGHFLGLGHSDTIDATMYASAAPGEIGKRTLHPDDVAAVQQLYPGADLDDEGVAEVGAAWRDDKADAPADGDSDESLPADEAPQIGCDAAAGGP